MCRLLSFNRTRFELKYNLRIYWGFDENVLIEQDLN